MKRVTCSFALALLICTVAAVAVVNCAEYSAEFNETVRSIFDVRNNNNNECVCLHYYQCDEDGNAIEDGAKIIDQRFGELEPQSCDVCKCDDVVKVCCRPPPNDNDNDGDGVSDKSPQLSSTTTTTTEQPPPPIKNDFKCGQHNPDGIGYRQGSDTKEATEFGEFPWMTAIMSAENGGDVYKYHCGGSLIHPRVVLTATHCVKNDKRRYRARVGEWNLQQTSEVYPHQEQDVINITTHKEYNSGSLKNDIALLLLREAVTLAPNVGIVCLPPKNIQVPTGVRCWASGWGKDVYSTQLEITLKKVELPIVDKAECQKRLRKTRPNYELHPSFVCAGGVVGKDTCDGDGGGPLVCPIAGATNRYYQAGIVSWGVACGTTVPAFYANVAYLRAWIDDVMQKYGFTIADYQFY